MSVENTRILIVGAGVIGSIYAINLSKAGCSVTMLARSSRLEELNEMGLVYWDEKSKSTAKVGVKVIKTLYDDDIYDYVFVTVRYDQIESTLTDIKNNQSQSIVTMVNNPFGYDRWERIIGEGRIIPAFPGAGGKIENGVLYYKLTPAFIQTTTFGELTGNMSQRVKRLYHILKLAGFPVKVCNNMDSWQKSHLAMVIPMANAIYFDGGNNFTTAKNTKAIHRMSLSLKENFKFLKESGIGITPCKLYIFKILPVFLLNLVLATMYNTRFAETLISNHANKAKLEMNLLTNDFDKTANKYGFSLVYLEPGTLKQKQSSCDY